MAKNKNKKQKNDSEFSEEVVAANNGKRTGANSTSENSNTNAKY
jgi:hypothetical protein